MSRYYNCFKCGIRLGDGKLKHSICVICLGACDRIEASPYYEDGEPVSHRRAEEILQDAYNAGWRFSDLQRTYAPDLTGPGNGDRLCVRFKTWHEMPCTSCHKREEVLTETPPFPGDFQCSSCKGGRCLCGGPEGHVKGGIHCRT